MRNNSVNFRQKLLVTAVTAAFVTGVYAQSATSNIEEIQITGTRIRNQTGMVTPTPVTAITTDELTNAKPGATIADELATLPQFFSTVTAQRTFGAISTQAGGSYLNLRGMGQNRTLVLLDGSRIVPADANNSVNIDNFPTALLKRVDVITGGASAAYGSDAVAGVVNFVVDRNFEGFKGSVSSGISELGTGENYSFSLAGGKAFMDNKLHIIGSLQARYIDQIDADASASNWKNYGLVRNPNYNGTAATNPVRIWAPYVFGNQSSPTGLILGPSNFSLKGYTFAEDGKSVRPYSYGQYSSVSGSGATLNQSGGNEYNQYVASNSNNLGVRGNEVDQRSMFLGAKYDVNDQLNVTAQLIMGRTGSYLSGQRASMAIAGATYAFTVFNTNPYLPQSVKDAMTAANITSFTMSKTGVINSPGYVDPYSNRTDTSLGQLASGTLGFDYKINDNWDLSGHFQRGRSKVATGLEGVPRIDLFFLSMDAVTDPTSGKTICNITKVNPSAASLAAFVAGKKLPSPITPDGVTVTSPIGPVDPSTCIPFNVLGAGNSNVAADNWMTLEQKIQSRILNQSYAEGLLTGEIYKGWGAGPVSLAVGATWRKEDFNQVNNPSYGERGVLNDPADGIRGISTGFASAGNRSLNPFSAIGVGGSKDHVSEEFAEVNIPVLKLESGQTLTSDLAYRSADFSNFGRTPSWKFGLDAQLMKDLRWRYTRSRDVREPTFAERYLTATGGGSVVDKATTANGTNVTNASLTILASPNPNLHNEQATTVTTGLVYQPTFASWVEGVQLSVDWYQINIASALARFGAQRIADDCFAGDAGQCALISRDPTTNVITRVLDEYQNIGKAQTRGTDLEVQYSFLPNWVADLDEHLTVKALVGYLSENSTTSFNGTVVDAANGQDRPKYTATVSANYQVGKFGVGIFERYVGHTLLNNTWIEGIDVDHNRIASQAVTNLNLSYGDKWADKNYKVSFGISNLFNRDQPIIPSTAGQVVDYNYDVFGRRFQLSLDVNF